MTDNFRKEIISRVRAFSDAMINGNVGDDILRRHKIPKEYLAVCRDNSHPSCKKFQNRLFEYLMFEVEYFDNVDNDTALSQLYANLDEMLQNSTVDHRKKGLVVPRFVFGVKDALKMVEKLNAASSVTFPEQEKVGNVGFGKVDRGFQLDYSKEFRKHLSIEDSPFKAITIKIDGEEYVVPNNGGYVSSHSVTFTQPDKVSIRMNKFHHANLHNDKLYYFRYITEVGEKVDVTKEFEKSGFDIDGRDTFAIESRVNGKRLLIFNYANSGKQYLIIEYDKPMTEVAMSDLCFATLVALGMITTTVYLNECWIVAYENSDLKSASGLYYKALNDSVHCNYTIFTSNVYPSLVNVAQRIDPEHGEHRACEIIDHLRLSKALPWFSNEVFGRLVENMLQFEELQRGIFVILMGSSLNLEIQAAIYCVALETISNLAPKIIGKKEESIIKEKKVWKEVYRRFKALSDELYQEGVITEKEKYGIDKKICSMNNSFNAEKLRALLVHYHYPIRKFDDTTLLLRNLLLHGNIEFKVLKDRKPEDYLFELSINLHKLCCAIALLMSGYKGYIVNNRKFYGFAGSYKAFIRIGDNKREEFPTL